MRTMARHLSLLAALLLSAPGCTAINSFPMAARAGDAVVLPIGRSTGLTRQNITITITPSAGSSVIYGPNDPNVLAVVNLYPDPVSRLIVGTETNQGLGYDADIRGAIINEQITDQDKDWWNSAVYFKLPTALPSGIAAINVTGPEGSVTQQPALVEILDNSSGQENPTVSDPWNTDEMKQWLGSLERADHYTLTFNSSVVPHSIQLELTYNAGIGKPWVINPRGDLKNLAWRDAGSVLRVMLTPSNGQTPGHLSYFKFYIGGNITGLKVTRLRAYDIFGRVVPDVSASIR